MDKSLQKKLVGAAVLIALVVIFLPMLLDGPKEKDAVSMQIEIPEKPVYEVPNRLPQPEPPATVEVAPQIAPGPAQTTAPTDGDHRLSSAVGQQPPAVAPVREIKPVAPPAAKPRQQATAKPATKKPARKQAARPARPPARKSSSAGKGAGYVVQVGSFSLSANANGVRDKLKKAGFPAFVQEVVINGKPIYRVKVGPRPSRGDADQLRLRLIDKLHIEGIIVAHP